MLKRRFGRLEHMSSIVVFGAASLGNVTQEEANESVQFALDHGINHFDTARDYGDSEIRLGHLMSSIRDQIFLATKTGKRTKDEAKKEIHESLERLQTDHVDLIQMHAVGDLEELDKITGKGGAVEAAQEAKEEGLVKGIGITGHGHAAPATHLEALKRFPFDSVLSPLNFHLYSIDQYREDFDALVEEIKRQDVAFRVIKAIAKGPWAKNQEQKYATWYEPFDEQKIIDACVAFILSHEEVTGFASAGDIHLLPKIVDAVTRHDEINQEEVHDTLSRIASYTTPFGWPTSIA
ncbi:MAG TPA: aldo/keto reductase [Bacillales bacterium]|nr:aldo/keto reductase [Bacillales bacterium]